MKAQKQSVKVRSSNRKDKTWLQNRDQLKTPKMFTMNVIRTSDGSFQLVGGDTKVLTMKNQYGGEWSQVDTRDFARELRSSRIYSR